MTVKLVLFDFDGTLLDSQNALISGLTQTAQHFDIPLPDRQTLLSGVGLPPLESIKYVFPDITDTQAQDFRDHFLDIFITNKEKNGVSPLYEGVMETLEILAQKDHVLVGVVTSMMRHGLDVCLKHHDIAKYFMTLQTPDTGFTKPNPEPILHAMKEAGVEAENTVMIGDTEFDIQTGHNAGTHSIGVTWGYHSQERLKKANAGTIVNTFEQLQQQLEAF